jgi:hypothetical protein
VSVGGLLDRQFKELSFEGTQKAGRTTVRHAKADRHKKQEEQQSGM